MFMQKQLQTLLAVLPALTAGLCLLGLEYHQGYLLAFGLDDSLFPLASEKILFSGFFSFVSITFPAWLYAFIAIGAFFILVIVVWVLSSTSLVNTCITSIKSKLRHEKIKEISPEMDSLLDKISIAFGLVGGLIIALLLLVTVAVFSEKAGREQGEKEIARFAKGEGGKVKIFSTQFPAGLTGKLVICGIRYCAIWLGSEAIVLKHEAIDRIVLFLPPAPSTGKTLPAP